MKWYVSEKNPELISQEELQERIGRGEVTAEERICREGQNVWKRADEWPELQRMDETNIAMQMTHSGEKQWVVLKPVQIGGETQYRQIGPFTTNQVLRMVHRGEISFGDFAWRSGFKKWVRISRIQEFEKRGDERKDEVSLDRIPLDVSVQEEIGLKDVFNHILVPETVITKDLSGQTQTAAEPLQRMKIGESLQPRVVELEPPADQPEIPSEPAPPLEEPCEVKGEAAARQPRPVTSFSRVIFSLALAAAGMVGIKKGLDAFWASRKQSESRSAEGAQEALDVFADQLDSERPVLRVAATGRQPVQIWIRGRSGRILRLASFFHSLTVKPTESGWVRVELKPLRIPPGSYQVDLQQGASHVRKSFFVGLENGDFQRNLSAHRKQISYLQQHERQEIWSTVTRLEKVAAGFQRATPEQRARLNPQLVGRIRLSEMDLAQKMAALRRHQLAFPEVWVEVGELNRKLKSQIEGGGRAPSSQEDLLASTRHLKAKMATLSAWQNP